jgi:hypothetical protein
MILDSLFSDVDSFCADEELRDESNLNEVQLLNSSKKALAKLKDFPIS